LLVNVAAPRLGWWRFQAEGGLFLGVPADLYLGWILLWGPLPVLSFTRLRPAAAVALLAALDLLLMPLAKPVVQLDRLWLVGEAAAIAVCLAPALMLARWTQNDTRVAWRAALQCVCFAGLMVGVLPAAILGPTGGNGQHLLASPSWLNGLGVQLLALPAVIGLSAVQEFAVRGHGTPLPYDPPVRLVTTGIYRYVASPMQISMTLCLFVLGAWIGSWWVAAAGLIALAYGAGIAGWNEETDMLSRYGRAWTEYRRAVRSWIPGWRPAPTPAAIIYVAGGCDMCRGVGLWISRRRPVGLTIKAAEDHPERNLSRIAYECDGYVDEGIAAFARALEHVSLAWAIVGCSIRLPLIRSFLQVVVDASGGGPRQVERVPAGAHELHGFNDTGRNRIAK
jgi:protein-S-isoprenylcysteine O-methyltransferase Ste14